VSARWDTRPLLRAMQPADLPAVMVVERQIYAFPWTEGNFRDSLASGYDVAVLEFAGQLVGYRVILPGAGDAHLLNLSIAAAWQRRGYGRQLLLASMLDARRAGAQVMLLEVRPSNEAAIALYASVGFRVLGTRRDYYPSEGGREDARVMSVNL